MKTTTELIWHALDKPDMPQMKKYAKPDTCCMCGVHEGTIRTIDTISSGFTNVDLLRYQESDVVCLYCYSAMKSLTAGDVLHLWEDLGSPTPDIDKSKLVNEHGRCAYCGKRDGNIKKTACRPVGFLNTAVEMNPSSDVACLPCLVMSNYGLRTCSWRVSARGIKLYRRETIAASIFCDDRPTDTPFLHYVTTSQKKLGQLKVQMNYDADRFTLLFEEIQVEVDPAALRPLWEIMCLFYSYPTEETEKRQPKTFFTKEEIRSGNYQGNRVKKFGMDEWKEREQLIRPYRGSGVLAMLLYILNAEHLGRCNARSDANGSREGSDSGKPDIPGLARDSVGQYEWFTEDGYI